MIKTIVRATVALGLATSLLAAHAVQGVKYVSTPGDFIGQGLSGTIEDAQATVYAYGDTRTAHVTVYGLGDEHWTFDFSAPEGATLVTGSSHSGVLGYPFNSPMEAGMSVAADGRACNRLLGWFDVLDYQVDASGKLSSLAIDFMQDCEITMPPLFGSVRFASQVPLAVPIIAAIAGRDFDMVSGQKATLDGTQSFSRKQGDLSYQWTQVAGPAATIKRAATATPTIAAPKVPRGGATLQFRLDVKDATGRVASDVVFVLVHNKKDLRTQLQVQGDPGDFVTLGHAVFLDTMNARFTFDTNLYGFAGSLGVTIAGDAPWNFQVGPPLGTTLQPGVYVNAQRFPFEPAGAPGLDFFGDGRGCNLLAGQYTVYQVKFDAAGQPAKLDIAFEQHCEGGNPAARGELLLNAVPHKEVAARLQAARAAARR